MTREENYRPVNIEFTVEADNSNMPTELGEHNSLEEAMKLIGSNLTSINQSMTVNRHMDFTEKKWLREQYNDELENNLPKLERELSTATQELSEAKKKAKSAEERVNASLTEVKILSKEVKSGVVSMNLDDISTSRVPYMGKYYYYTYMDKQLKLCCIREIPEHEKSDLYNAMAGNESFIDENFGDGKVESEKGKKE